MRELIHVPMIHSPEALIADVNLWGSAGAEALADYSRANYSDYWSRLQKKIAGLRLRDVRVYYESFISSLTPDLNNNFFKISLVEELQKMDIPEVDVLVPLIKKSRRFIIERTEDRNLMEVMKQAVVNFRLVRLEAQGLDNVLPPGEDVPEEFWQSCVSRIRQAIYDFDLANLRRDEFISERITQTLRVGETGMLFLGALHDVVSRLPQDIKVTVLDESLVKMAQGAVELEIRNREELLRALEQA